MRATVLGPDLTPTPCSAVRVGYFSELCVLDITLVDGSANGNFNPEMLDLYG